MRPAAHMPEADRPSMGPRMAFKAFASDTSVLVTLSAEPSASDTLAVRYASGVTYGHGCVRDSDPTTADDAWEHVSGRTDADTNAALLGAPYPLPNWAVAQHIEVT